MYTWLRALLGIDKLEQALAAAHDRITQLEKKVVQVAQAAVLASKTPAQELTLTSPDGTQSITLKADNGVTGIWIGSNQPGKPMVAIYNDVTGAQGACVGIWGPADAQGNRRGGLDAAIHYASGYGGCIQLMDDQNEVHQLDSKLVAGIPAHQITKFAAHPAAVGQLPPA